MKRVDIILWQKNVITLRTEEFRVIDCFQTIQADKSGIYRVITVMVNKLFTKFCAQMKEKAKNEARDRKLEAIAVILLIEFNNLDISIRKAADTYLSELVGVFPHLLWSKNVLYGMLDAVHQLSQCLDDEEEPEVYIGKMKRRVVLLDTFTERQAILRTFAERVKNFIATSVQWAPDTVLSHLQVQTFATVLVLFQTLKQFWLK